MKVFFITMLMLYISGCQSIVASHIKRFNGAEVTSPSRSVAVTDAMVLSDELDSKQRLAIESATHTIIDAVLFVTFQSRHAEHSEQFKDASPSFLAKNDAVVVRLDSLSYLSKMTDWVVDDTKLQFTLYYAFKNANKHTNKHTNTNANTDTIDKMGQFYRLPSTYYLARVSADSEWQFIKNEFGVPLPHLR